MLSKQKKGTAHLMFYSNNEYLKTGKPTDKEYGLCDSIR